MGSRICGPIYFQEGNDKQNVGHLEEIVASYFCEEEDVT